MSKKTYNVAIALRTYAGTKPSRTRAIFHDNKYKLFKLCLKSLKDSLGNLKVKMFALLDSCSIEWEESFRIHFDSNDLEIMNLKSAGEIGSIKIAMNKLIKQNDSEIVFMAEDDYYYLPNQFGKMIEFLKENNDIHFVTPYDHLDLYTRVLHDYLSYIKVFAGKHWRNISLSLIHI